MRRPARGWRRRGLVAAVAFAVALPVTIASAQPRSPAKLSPLSNHGGHLTDASGRTVVLHGLNMVAKRPPYEPAATGFGDDDAAFLAANGFRAVRLGIILAGLEPRPGRFDDGYLDSIQATVQTLARHGIYSLLDFHQDLLNERYGGEGLPEWMLEDDQIPPQPQAGFPGTYFTMPALERAFDNFWANAPGPRGIGLQDEYAAAWRHVAERFRDDPAVLGYDLFNEPWPGSQWPTCFPPAGCPVFDQQSLAPFTDRVTAAIRKADSRHLVVYEPGLPFDYTAPTYVGAVADGQSALGFHAYCLAAVGVPETPPTRQGCDFAEARTFDNADAHAAETGHALLLTEFGATHDTQELTSVAGLADAHRVSWLEWAYCACDDPTGNGDNEGLVHDPAKAPSGDNVDAPTLTALARPYPLAVAGDPQQWSFDPATRAFALTYRAAGRAPAITEIVLPALQYPHGYRVTVTGGRTVGSSGGTLLRVQALAPHQPVVVRVSPR